MEKEHRHIHFRTNVLNIQGVKEGEFGGSVSEGLKREDYNHQVQGHSFALSMMLVMIRKALPPL